MSPSSEATPSSRNPRSTFFVTSPSASLASLLGVLGPIAWLALAAGLQMAGALLLFKTTPSSLLVLSYVALSFGVYLLNRFTDDEDSHRFPARERLFHRRSPLIAVPVALLLLPLVMLGHAGVLSTWHVVLAVGGFLYSVPIVPCFEAGSLRLLRLKEVAALKNLTVSVLWGVPPFAIASSLETASAPPIGALLVVVAAFCLTTLINTTSCDVRDIESDSAFGITTLAVRLGKNTVGAFLFALSLLGCIVVAMAWQWGAVGAHATALFFVTLIWTGLVALPVYRHELRLPEWLGEPLIDTQQIACGLLLVVMASRIHGG